MGPLPNPSNPLYMNLYNQRPPNPEAVTIIIRQVYLHYRDFCRLLMAKGIFYEDLIGDLNDVSAIRAAAENSTLSGYAALDDPDYLGPDDVYTAAYRLRGHLRDLLAEVEEGGPAVLEQAWNLYVAHQIHAV